jgi:virulence-associated protein VagC
MTTTQIVHDGNRQTVQLPPGFEFDVNEVAVRRAGDAVILEPIKSSNWREGFFDQIRIVDPAFQRPNQGTVPTVPKLDGL